MKVHQTENGFIRIDVSGRQLLEVKSRFQSYVEKSDRFGIEFEVPVLANEEFSQFVKSNQSCQLVKNLLNKYDSHRVALLDFRQSLESQGVSGIPNAWLSILDLSQAVAVSSMITPGLLGLCLYDEQGSGKTVMTLAALDILLADGLLDSAVVVCPKSMVPEWLKDAGKFLNDEIDIKVAEGDRGSRSHIAASGFDMLITNYEGVEAIKTAVKAVSRTKKIALVVDESYFVKNRQAARSAHLRELRKSVVKCFMLCGTPAPNSAYDLVNQFDAADMGYTFGGFKKTSNKDQDFGLIENLVNNRGAMIRRQKSDILDHVPDKNFHIVGVSLTGWQKRTYHKAKDELVLWLKQLNNESLKKHLTSYFQRRTALLRICSDPGGFDPSFQGESDKLIQLDALLDRLIREDKKVVIWSSYIHNLDCMWERYTNYNPVRIYGSVSESERKLAVSRFQEDPAVKLFIGNPAAAGAGITLHSASDAVYVSYTNQAANYLQSLDRIHRRGQVANEVNYHLLVCENTIEEWEVQRLRTKELNQHSLLGDNITWPSSLDETLSELTGHD